MINEHARAEKRATARPDAGRLHQQAAFRLGWPELECLGRIAVPTLVIHGTADHVLPVAHAQAFARHVPGCELAMMDGMGHLPTRTEWETVTRLVIDHVTRARRLT